MDRGRLDAYQGQWSVNSLLIWVSYIVCPNKTDLPLTETVDWQTIKVQEIMRDGQREAGRIPRTVECELTLDLGGL